MAGRLSSPSYLDQYQNQSPRHANISSGRAMSVQGASYDDYHRTEPMVTEASDTSNTELCKTREILQMLDNMRPLIEQSRQEVATAKEQLASQAKGAMSDVANATITEQGKEIEELRKKLTEKERDNKSIEEKYQIVCDELQKSKKVTVTLRQKMTELTTEKNYLSQINQSLKEQLQNIETEKSKMKEELNNMKTRLSKVLGNKISDNNPDIADLSDMNRPTKIGERYSELYDNEWTDAFEVFHDYYHHDEKASIKDLLSILKLAKKQCSVMAEEQSKSITEALYMAIGMDQSQADVKKQIKDMRKETATLSMRQVQKRFNEYLMGKTCSIDPKFAALFQSEKVQAYIEKCVEICWLMSVQDPPLTFGEVRENEVFDTSKYKHYTRTGDRIEYLVWPEMYLKEGALLCKGVAQGAGRAQSARNRRRGNDTTDEERPQTAPPSRNVETQHTVYQQQQGYSGINHQQANHGANDQMYARSTPTYARDHAATTTTNTSTQVRANGVMLQYDWESLKCKCPPDVNFSTWMDFLFYTRHGLTKDIELRVGTGYHACIQHYNSLVRTETDI